MTITVDTTFTKQCVTEWQALQHDRYANDLAIAQLAKKIRDIFPTGNPGDVQFLAFVKRYLKHCRSDVMLIKALSFNTFTAQDWFRFGGWFSINFLLKLKKAQRRQLTGQLKGPGPYHYSTILKHARSLGFETADSNGVGRPSREVQEAKTRAMSNWLIELYRTRPDLPPMPNYVRAALSHNQLSEIASKIGARA